MIIVLLHYTNIDTAWWQYLVEIIPHSPSHLCMLHILPLMAQQLK